MAKWFRVKRHKHRRLELCTSYMYYYICVPIDVLITVKKELPPHRLDERILLSSLLGLLEGNQYNIMNNIFYVLTNTHTHIHTLQTL